MDEGYRRTYEQTACFFNILRTSVVKALTTLDARILLSASSLTLTNSNTYFNGLEQS